MPELGVEYLQPSEYCPDYIRLEKEISKNVPEMDFVMYERGSYVKTLSDTKVLAKIINPYFNRTFRTFTSHAQTPADKESPYPAVTKSGKIIYIYAPIFKAYFEHGYFVYKKIVENCIDTILREKFVITNAPSSEVSLTKQGDRIVAHIVNFQPQRRGRGTEYIEEGYPLRELELKVRTETRPRRVYLAPKKKYWSSRLIKKYTSCVVPEVLTHQMVVYEF